MNSTHPVYQLIRESIEPGSTELGSASTGKNVSGVIENIDWNEVFTEMKAQAVETLPQKWLLVHTLPDEELRKKWIRTTYAAQTRWIKLMNGQRQLLELLEKEKIDCVIIKGAASAMAYPQPTLRQCGDIDFLVREKDYERAAKVLEDNGFELGYGKNPLNHHYEYEKDGISYELHRRLGIISKDNHELIEVFDKGISNREFAQIEDISFPVLPAELNGLVLMFHINQHIRDGLGLRQILDWLMYLRKNDNPETLLPVFKSYGMEKLALTVTVACQEYFGLKKMVEDSQQYPYDELMDYIWQKGNFGHKGGEDEKVASVFLIVSNPVRLFQRLQEGGLNRWKAAAKYKFLRPFAWIYQTFRIMHEIIVNRITPKKLIEQRKVGVNQRELIGKLGLDLDREV